MQLYTRKLNFNNTKLIQSLDSYTYEWLYQVSKGAIGKFLPKEIIAIDYLVRSLKEEGLWDKFIAIYPFIGRTAELHSYNLISSSWQITWYGGLVHDEWGVTSDGSSGYGDIATLISLWPGHTSETQHMSVYLTENSVNSFIAGFFNGSNNGTEFHFGVTSALSGGLAGIRSAMFRNSWYQPFRTPITSNVGFFAGVTNSGASQILRGNGVTTTATQPAGTTAPITSRMNIFRNSRGNAGDYSAARAGCITIGYGMTSNELTALDNIVSETQTILGRRAS